MALHSVKTDAREYDNVTATNVANDKKILSSSTESTTIPAPNEPEAIYESTPRALNSLSTEISYMFVTSEFSDVFFFNESPEPDDPNNDGPL